LASDIRHAVQEEFVLNHAAATAATANIAREFKIPEPPMVQNQHIPAPHIPDSVIKKAREIRKMMEKEKAKKKQSKLSSFFGDEPEEDCSRCGKKKRLDGECKICEYYKSLHAANIAHLNFKNCVVCREEIIPNDEDERVNEDEIIPKEKNDEDEEIPKEKNDEEEKDEEDERVAIRVPSRPWKKKGWIW